MRIGHGYDVHRFSDEGDLVLGGVRVPFDRGLDAHSDGDVVLHAICDALLGAAALGDIGQHFPDDDAQFSNIDSRILLRSVYEKILFKGHRLGNLDVTIVAQAPRMSPYIAEMRQKISSDLLSPECDVNVKATTTERLGFTGREEGIAVHAICLLVPNNSGVDDDVFSRIYDDA